MKCHSSDYPSCSQMAFCRLIQRRKRKKRATTAAARKSICLFHGFPCSESVHSGVLSGQSAWCWRRGWDAAPKSYLRLPRDSASFRIQHGNAVMHATGQAPFSVRHEPISSLMELFIGRDLTLGRMWRSQAQLWMERWRSSHFLCLKLMLN